MTSDWEEDMDVSIDVNLNLSVTVAVSVSAMNSFKVLSTFLDLFDFVNVCVCVYENVC